MKEIQEPSAGRQRGNSQLVTRLTFSYEGDNVTLVSQQTVRMTLPPSDPLQPEKEESGFWYELKDAGNKTHFRKAIEDPIQHFLEVPSGDPDRPFSWQELEKPAGMFTILVPEIKEAREVRLFSSPHGKARGQAAKEIGRFAIKDDGTRKER